MQTGCSSSSGAAVQRCSSAVEGNQDPRYWRPRRAHGLHGRVVLQVIRIRVGQDGWVGEGGSGSVQTGIPRCTMRARNTTRGLIAQSVQRVCRGSESRRGRAGMALLSVECRASSRRAGMLSMSMILWSVRADYSRVNSVWGRYPNRPCLLVEAIHRYSSITRMHATTAAVSTVYLLRAPEKDGKQTTEFPCAARHVCAAGNWLRLAMCSLLTGCTVLGGLHSGRVNE